MRVHRLEIEAFGPFAEPVVVDVDALSAEGLFLIHGPTGSGKTSLLDAICFALYADVPGARSKRGLRSDHAQPDAVPRVVLEVTAGARRLRITRSPEFHRPKKRGSGTSKVQATVSLEERQGSRWVPLSTRHDEVADVVRDALGMGMAQFAKVVLLPQGDFAAFLRATPEDRREVLERLFDIRVFTDIEAWLAEQRRVAGAELEKARTALTAELARVDEVLADASVEASAGGPLHELPPGSVPPRLRQVVDALDARATATMAAFDAASGAERAAADALAAGRALHDLRSRGLRATSQLATLEATLPAHLGRVERLARAERAAALAGHLAATDRAVHDVRVAACETDLTRGALAPGPLASVSDDEVGAVLDRVGALDRTVSAIRRETDAAAASSLRRAALESDAARLRHHAEELTTALEELDSDLERLAAEQEHLGHAAGRVPQLQLRLGAALDRLVVLEAAEEDLRSAAELAPGRSMLREAVLDRRTELLDLRQRRLDGMSAELANSLRDGNPCPVCGGLEHPKPARVSDPVLPDDLSRAESRLEVAERELRAVDSDVEALTTRAETRLASLDGADRELLEATVADLGEQLAAARDEETTHAEVTRRLSAAADTVAAHREELAATRARLEFVTARLAEQASNEAVALGRLTELRHEHDGCPCGSTEPAEHERMAVALLEHRAAVDQLAGATARAGAARGHLEAALIDAGFDDEQSVRSAVLDDDATARLRALVTAHVEHTAGARAVAEEPEVVAALAAPPPDLVALAAADRAAREALLAAAADQDGAARALRGVRRLLTTVDHACAAVAVAAERDAQVRDLADTASGTGPDNTLRMRLTAYVLAARLEKVAALANERLAVMGAGRYVLEHSDERAARGARSGLGLRVLDQWTGRVRDTASLSGGESFMASLALALGLADAVREEAGGLDLGTLFIDEGFGSLDDDSLEQVLSVLDGLREGGRAVGVVSHVADLRARITHQAVVHKGASGSTVEVRTGRVAEPAA